jgi:hypothetical protein
MGTRVASLFHLGVESEPRKTADLSSARWRGASTIGSRIRQRAEKTNERTAHPSLLQRADALSHKLVLVRPLECVAGGRCRIDCPPVILRRNQPFFEQVAVPPKRSDVRSDGIKLRVSPRTWLGRQISTLRRTCL